MPRRPLAVLVLPVLLLAALALAACGGEDAAESSADPNALLDSAFTKPIDSGTFDGRLKANLEGDGVPGAVDVRFEGPFESNGDDLPRVDLDVTVGGGGISLQGGLVATGDNAFVEFKGQAYEVGRELYAELQRALERQGGSGYSLKELGVRPSTWFEDPRAEDGGEVKGAQTTKVSGDLDLLKMLDDLVEGARKANPDADVEPLEGEERRELEQAVEEARSEVYVADDGTMRRFVLNVKLDAPEGARDGFQGGTVTFDVSIGDVGEAQEIEAPDDARPIGDLLREFGLGGAPAGLRQ